MAGTYDTIRDAGLAVPRGQDTTLVCTVADLPGPMTGWAFAAAFRLTPAYPASDPDPDGWAFAAASTAAVVTTAGGVGTPGVVEVTFPAAAMLGLVAGRRKAVFGLWRTGPGVAWELVPATWADVTPHVT